MKKAVSFLLILMLIFGFFPASASMSEADLPSMSGGLSAMDDGLFPMTENENGGSMPDLESPAKNQGEEAKFAYYVPAVTDTGYHGETDADEDGNPADLFCVDEGVAGYFARLSGSGGTGNEEDDDPAALPSGDDESDDPVGMPDVDDGDRDDGDGDELNDESDIPEETEEDTDEIEEIIPAAGEIMPTALGELLTFISAVGFFANGRALIIDGVDGYPNLTNIYFAEDYPTTPIDLSKGLNASGAEVSTDLVLTNGGYNLTAATNRIHLGCYNQNYTGDVSVVVKGGNIVSLMGGGGCNTAGAVANLYGNVSISIEGGTLSNVYGGGRAATTTNADVYGDVTITMTGGTVKPANYIFGGGTANVAGSTAHIFGDTKVEITGGTLTAAHGGGQAAGAGAQTNVTGTATVIIGPQVTLTSGTVVFGGGMAASGANSSAIVNNAIVDFQLNPATTGNSFSVYGGGRVQSHATADASVNNSTIIYSGISRSSTGFNGAIYGGGQGTTLGVSRVKNSNIIISGVCNNLYTGGSTANTAITDSSTITVIGGTVINTPAVTNNNAAEKSLYMSGGSLDGAALTDYTRQVSEINTTSVYKTSLTIFKNGIALPAAVKVDSLDFTLGGEVYTGYNLDNLYTDASGKINLMLPEGVKVEGARIAAEDYEVLGEIIAAADDTAAGALYTGDPKPPMTPTSAISGFPAEMDADEFIPIVPSFIPTNATHKNIIWSIDDPDNTGLLYENGILTAAKPGVAVITATVKNGTAWGTDFVQTFPIDVRITLTDNEVTAKAVVDSAGAVFTATKIDDHDNDPDLSALTGVVTAFDTTLTGNRGSDKITLTLPLGSTDYNGRTVEVTHIYEGTSQTYSVIAADGTVTVTIEMDNGSESLGKIAISAVAVPVVYVTNFTFRAAVMSAASASTPVDIVLTEDVVYDASADNYDGFNIKNAAGVTIRSDDPNTRRTLTITGERSGHTFYLGKGSLIFKDLNLKLEYRNTDSSLPAAIFMEEGRLLVDNCIVTGSGEAGKYSTRVFYIWGFNNKPFPVATFTNSTLSDFAYSYIVQTSNAELRITDCTIENNGRAPVNLGAESTATIKGGLFQNNHQPSFYGGAIAATSARNLTVDGTVFKNCSADLYGGAICIMGSNNSEYVKILNNITIDGCQAYMSYGTDNAKDLRGGGGLAVCDSQQVWMNGGTITDCEVFTRTSGDDGGGGGGGVLVLKNAKLTLNGTEISGNKATRGGGVFVYNDNMFDTVKATVNVIGGKIHDNHTVSGAKDFTGLNYFYGGGGGIYVGQNSSLTVSGGTEICHNTARRGGGICGEDYLTSYGSSFMNIISAYIHDNIAEGRHTDADSGIGNGTGLGGGIYVGYANTNYFGATIMSGNYADLRGGGVWICPTGNINVRPLDGAAIYGNHTLVGPDALNRMPRGDDVHVEVANNRSGNVTVSPVVLGAGYANWYKDEFDSRDGDVAEKAYYTNRALTGTDVISLKSHISGAEVQRAYPQAVVMIENNHADTAGGGIALNGIGDFGKSGAIQAAVKLVKKDKNTGAPLEGAIFRLYQADGTPVTPSMYTTDVNGEFTVIVADGQAYYFEETKAPFGYKMETPGTKHSFAADYTRLVEVVVDNEKLESSLSMTKVIRDTDINGGTYDASADAKKFDFTVKIGDPFVAGTVYKYHINGGAEQTFANGGKISLGHGDHAIFTGIPVGTAYEVIEDNYYEHGEESYISEGGKAVGTIKENGLSEAKFTNIFSPKDVFKNADPDSSLIVMTRILAHPEDIDVNQKFTVRIEIGDTPQPFTYQVVRANTTLDQYGNPTIYYDANDPNATNATAQRPDEYAKYDMLDDALGHVSTHTSGSHEIEIELTHGDAIIIYGIPIGTAYSVIQYDPSADGYLIDSTYKSTGVILPDQDILPDHDNNTNDDKILRVRADIFNYFTQPILLTYEITKNWVGGAGYSGEVTVYLATQKGIYDSRYAVKFGSVDQWKSTLSAPKYDELGNTIHYILEELPVTDYSYKFTDITPANASPNYSSFILTNTYTGGSTPPGGGGGGVNPDPGTTTEPGIDVPIGSEDPPTDEPPTVSPYPLPPTEPINPEEYDPDIPLRYSAEIPGEFIPENWTVVHGIDENGFEFWELVPDDTSFIAGPGKPSGVPKTGDSTPLTLSIIMMLLSVMMLCVWLAQMQKANNRERGSQRYAKRTKPRIGKGHRTTC